MLQIGYKEASILWEYVFQKYNSLFSPFSLTIAHLYFLPFFLFEKAFLPETVVFNSFRTSLWCVTISSYFKHGNRILITSELQIKKNCKLNYVFLLTKERRKYVKLSISVFTFFECYTHSVATIPFWFNNKALKHLYYYNFTELFWAIFVFIKHCN